MRILHIGNLANNSYKLAKFQRQLGHDAYLQLTSDQLGTGDDPAWEDGELSNGYPDWIEIRDVVPSGFLRRAARGIRRSLRERRRIADQFDVVHAQCLAPIMAQFTAPDRFVSHCLGSDLRELAQTNTIAGFLLRRAYRRSRVVFFNNVDHIALLRTLGIEGTFLPNPLDLERFAPGTPVRRFPGHDFILFHPARLDWVYRGADRSSTKGNDRLVRAFARFVRGRPRALLLLLNSGVDVEATRKLIAALGIEENVKFLNRLRKGELIEMIKSVDLVADQFNIGAFGGSALEVMACGKPLLTYLKEDCALACYGELPPLFNGRTENEILRQLNQAANSDCAGMGLAARGWMEKHHNWRVVAADTVSRYSSALL